MGEMQNKAFGQYFTPPNLAKFMVGLVSKSPEARILDPSAGLGVFSSALQDAGFRNVEAVELDPSLVSQARHEVQVQDFLTTTEDEEFDVVIGNPPYVRWRNISSHYRNFLRHHPLWKDRINGLGDLSHAFIVHSAAKLVQGGELVFITPLFWTETMHSSFVRRFLSERGEMDTMVMLGEARLFPSVASTFLVFKYVKEKTGRLIKVVDFSGTRADLNSMEDAELLLRRLERRESAESESGAFAFLQPQFGGAGLWKPIPPHVRPHIAAIESACTRKAPAVKIEAGRRTLALPLSELFLESELEELDIPRGIWKEVKWEGQKRYVLPAQGNLLTREGTPVQRRYVKLGDIMDIGNGLVSGLDKAFRVANPREIPRDEQSLLVSVVKARCLRRLYHVTPERYIFANRVESEEELRDEFPTIYALLRPHREALERRYQYGRLIPWWHWVFLRNYELISGSEKMIVTPCKERFNHRGHVRFALAEGSLLVKQDVTAIVPRSYVKEDVRYLLAMLSSGQTYLWLRQKGLSRGGVLEFSEAPLSRIPIRLIDWKDSAEVKLHNEIAELVGRATREKRSEPFLQEAQSRIDELYVSWRL